jgi:hypothetical protein
LVICYRFLDLQALVGRYDHHRRHIPLITVHIG